MWTAFPPADYYTCSAPSRGHQPTTDLPFGDLDGQAGGRPEPVPTFTHATGRQGRCPAMPRQPRHGYAAVLHHGLRAGDFSWSGESPTTSVVWAHAADRPMSARFRADTPLTGLCHWFTRVAPSRLDCRTRAVWQFRPVPSLSGLLLPSLASPRSGCPHLLGPAATGPQRSPSISARSYGASWRTPTSA